MMDRKSQLEEWASEIVDAAIQVHRELGPGLLESAYETCLEFELRDRGISVERQKALPVTYRGVQLDAGYRLDLLIESSIIIEVKAVDSLSGIHQAQLLTYLRLSGLQLGFLMNFNVRLMKDGLKRVVHQFPD
jgi:GxxExxY protein